MKRRRQSLILGIFLLLCGLGIGYAFLNTTLNINGVADIDSNQWEVAWESISVAEGSVDATFSSYSYGQTSITYNVHLSQPGDYLEFTVPAANHGSLDAMIDSISKTVNNSTMIPSYLDYTVSYGDGIALEKYQILHAGKEEEYKVRVSYKDDINPADLPSSSESLSITFGVTYVQADSNAKRVRDHVFTWWQSTAPNTPIENNVYFNNHTYLSSAYDVFAMNTIDIQNVKEAVVLGSSIGFERNNQLYYIHGGGATYDEDTYLYDSIYYASNKAVLNEAFGEDKCDETTYEDSPGYAEYHCSDGNDSAYICITGHTQVYINNCECAVFSDGSSSCGCE